MGQGEVLALSAVDESTEGDSTSNVSELTEDFGEMPCLSQGTYEVSGIWNWNERMV